MKKNYTAPSIYVESLELDRPIAAACSTFNRDDYKAMLSFGYFGNTIDCATTDGKQVLNRDGFVGTVNGYDYLEDAYCYHSSVNVAFGS